MCVHIRPALRMFLYPEREVCDKLEACAIAGSHRHTHARTHPTIEQCVFVSCAESTGGEQSPHCAARPFGCLHAAFQRGAPPAFGSASLVGRAPPPAG